MRRVGEGITAHHPKSSQSQFKKRFTTFESHLCNDFAVQTGFHVRDAL